MALFDDDYYGTIAHKVCWFLVSIPTVIFVLRIVCRVRAKPGHFGALGIDDAIALLCIIVLLITQILITIAATHGLGKHWDTLAPGEQILAMKYNTIVNASINWAFSLPKFAIIALLRKLLNYGTKTSILFWTLAGIGQVSILALSIWCFEQCDPVAKNWNPNLEGTCAPIKILTGLGYFTSSYSACLDLFFSLYPVPLIMKLNLPLRNRISVSVILGLGSIACIVQIYKLSILGQAFAIMATDPSYPIPYLNTMGLTEACILNVCASLPALGPLFRLFRAKFGGKSQNTSAMGGSNFNGGVGYSGRATRSTRTRNGWGHLNGIEVHSSIEVLRTPKDMADLKSIEMSPVSRERKSDIDSIV